MAKHIVDEVGIQEACNGIACYNCPFYHWGTCGIRDFVRSQPTYDGPAQEKPNVIERYIKDHGPRIDMARGQDRTVVIVLVDGVPVQTPKWMVDIMEKLKERDGMNVSQTFVDEWIGEKQHGRDGKAD